MEQQYIKQRYVRAEELEIGKFCTSHLFNKSKEILLPANHRIHPWYLEEWKSEHILTEGEFHIEENDGKKRNEHIGYMDKEIRLLLHQYYQDLIKYKELVQNPQELTLYNLQQLVNNWIVAITNTDNLSQLLAVCRYVIYDNNDYLYVHCLDTMIISLCIYANYYGVINFSELSKLGIGALLADIGMFLTSLELRSKSDTLTEEEKEKIKLHPLLGYRFIVNKLELPDIYAVVALEHHERVDGSGYPKGLKYNELHPNSIIVSLADVFSSQLRQRTFKNPKEPVEILKDFIQTMMPTFIKSDKQFMSSFISFVTIYPITSIVQISTGEIGIVIQTRAKNPLKPILLLLLDKDKKPYNTKVELDMLKKDNQEISIIGFYTQDLLQELKINYNLL